jgi:cytochrome c-type biogenesis protein CcmH
MKRNSLLLLIAFISIFSVVTVVYAQGKVPSDDEVNAIAKKLYCPVCPNTPLDVCETKACEDWRAQIRDQLTAGWNDQQIIDYFVAQYGERVLAEPQRKGFSSLVWMLPVLGVVLGVVLVWQVLRNWRSVRQSPIPKVSTVQVSPETIERIEKELREMK